MPNDLQHVALTIAGVPDGHPTQPYAGTPYCVGRAGTPGTIVEAAPELQFEGDGTYTVRVSVGPGSGGPADCLAGPTTTASFRVGVRVAPVLVGSPVIFRVQPLPANAFAGVRAAPAAGWRIRRPLRARRDRRARRLRDRSRRRARPELRAPGGDRGRVPAARPVDLRRARRRGGPRRELRHGHVQHAVVGAAPARRRQRLPPPGGHDREGPDATSAPAVQGRVAGRVRRRRGDGDALPRQGLPPRRRVQAAPDRRLPAGTSARGDCSCGSRAPVRACSSGASTSPGRASSARAWTRPRC